MNFIPSKKMKYPDSEKEKLNELKILFKEWYDTVKKLETFRNYTENDLVFDGFYPYYYSQNIKILFIGRESIDLHGVNYIENLYAAYKNHYIDKQHINTNSFARRLMYVAYGILNNIPNWHDVPYADQIANSFATKDGISFAFMNISKFSNDGKKWQADWELIEKSYKDSTTKNKNLIRSEIDILNPDVIIAMNLDEKIYSFGELEVIQESDKNVHEYWVKGNKSKNYLLLNSYHFTAFKNDLTTFYEPICKATHRNLNINRNIGV